MRREAARVRKLHPVQEGVLGLPAAPSELKALRGYPDRPKAPCCWPCTECAASQPRAYRPQTSRRKPQPPATPDAAPDAEYSESHDDALPPHREPPIQ